MKKEFFLLFALISRSYQQDDVGYFWHVTDFHYDWTYFGEQLSCNEKVPNPGKYGEYDCDSPWALINDSIVAMETIKSEIDFIIWTGDNAPHISNDKMGVDDTLTVMVNITNRIEEVFPDIPVYATFGNHDFYPHNQVPVANFTEYLFRRMAEKWKPWIIDNLQIENFKKGGYYTIKTSRGLRILSLNTNLYYNNNDATEHINDPLDQFSWAEKVLNDAKTNQEKVVVIAHIPPGFAATRGVGHMYESHHKRLVDMYRKYADIIVAIHCGHEHVDSFRLLSDTKGTSKIPIFMAPSVTPWSSVKPTQPLAPHNPGIRLVKYNRTNSLHMDYTQYYIKLPDSNKDRHADWSIEYSMTDAYRIADLSPESISSLIEKMKNYDNSLVLDFFKRTKVSVNSDSSNVCNQKCKDTIICSFTEYDQDSFNKCVEAASDAQALHNSVNTTLLLIALLSLLFLVFSSR